jgi:hypothetical protein
MTDKEKLNQLFQAALKGAANESKPLARALPKQESIPMPAPLPQQEPVIATLPVAPFATEPLVVPMENAGLDLASSTELGIMLDEQNARLKRRHRRETILALAACLALTGGSYGWFVNSPARVEAFHQVIRDVRATGDIKGMVASYTKSLNKIAARSTQIDQSTMAMGVSANQDDAKDPNFDAEMKAMMGGQGKTTGDRNKLLKQAFGKKIGNTDTPAVPVTKEVAKIAKDVSFEWK